jgi:hypothetical protein
MMVQPDTTAARLRRSLHSLIHRQQHGEEARGIRSGIRLSLGARQSRYSVPIPEQVRGCGSSAILVGDRLMSSANGAFGRHDRHDRAGMRLVTPASVPIRGRVQSVGASLCGFDRLAAALESRSLRSSLRPCLVAASVANTILAIRCMAVSPLRMAARMIGPFVTGLRIENARSRKISGQTRS